MKHIFTTLAILSTAVPAVATDVTLPDLAELKWVSRPIVIFADSAADPRLAQQLAQFEANQADLDERDVVVLVDTDPGTLSELRRKFRPRDFNILVIGKDGEVKYRKPNPITVREVSRLIDRMPMRQQEMEAMRASQ
ncbi:MAG: DUF4174 domain-containing protein [Pseudomonadota bacterium]